jgi:hypothetical protein
MTPQTKSRVNGCAWQTDARERNADRAAAARNRQACPSAGDDLGAPTVGREQRPSDRARQQGADGRRRANLAADYVRTSPVVLEPFTNPPGCNSLGANAAMLKTGGKRTGFVRDRDGNPVDHTTATLDQFMESAIRLPARLTMSTTRSRN